MELLDLLDLSFVVCSKSLRLWYIDYVFFSGIQDFINEYVVLVEL